MKAYQKETELTDKEYREVLDELYGTVQVCGLTYSSGYALEELDPTAFRCGKAEYESSLDEDNSVWICNSCSEEFDTEEAADECCIEAENAA